MEEPLRNFFIISFYYLNLWDTSRPNVPTKKTLKVQWTREEKNTHVTNAPFPRYNRQISVCIQMAIEFFCADRIAKSLVWTQFVLNRDSASANYTIAFAAAVLPEYAKLSHTDSSYSN